VYFWELCEPPQTSERPGELNDSLSYIYEFLMINLDKGNSYKQTLNDSFFLMTKAFWMAVKLVEICAIA
jgi:hypothetical protein